MNKLRFSSMPDPLNVSRVYVWFARNGALVTLERLNREIKRRTKPIGAFPDGNSALMLVCARLRHVTGSDWGIKRYMNMDHLLEQDPEQDNMAG